MFGGAKGSLEGFGGTGPSNAALAWGVHVFLYLARHVPRWWETLLRLSSPFFSLLEGIASLLVIQSLAHISRWVIERGARRGGRFGGAEGFQLLFLLASALTYVGSAVALWASFEGAARGSALAAALVGVSVSSTLWLTGIAFAVRKGNVIETSLMVSSASFFFDDAYHLGR